MSSVEAVLYWIRSPDMVDIKTQGYVGVTRNLKRRICQHKSACKNEPQTYNSVMVGVVVNNIFVVDEIFKGSLNDCYKLENELRSHSYIGWNLKVGGDKIISDSDKLIYAAYRQMRYLAKNRGLSICYEWTLTSGFEDFKSFYNSLSKNKEMVLPSSGEVNKDTLLFLSRSELIKIQNRNIDFFGDGVLMSNSEISELLCIDKPNTLATQRKRGWSNGKIFMKAWENDKTRNNIK